MGQVLAFPPASAAPGFERAAAAFVAAHTGGPGAWAAGTAQPAHPRGRARTNTPTLLARSRHASVRSLERYARPGPEAVARHVAANDPAARRRQP